MLGRYFLQTSEIYLLFFLTFPHATPRPGSPQPATSAVAGKCGRGEGLSGTRGDSGSPISSPKGLGMARKSHVRAEGFLQNGERRGAASHASPKAGFCTCPAQRRTEGGEAATPGAEQSRPADPPLPGAPSGKRGGTSPGAVANASEKNPDTRLQGKELRKGEQILTLPLALFGSPR